eukprot:199202-Hanusia_phi.AAC.10
MKGRHAVAVTVFMLVSLVTAETAHGQSDMTLELAEGNAVRVQGESTSMLNVPATSKTKAGSSTDNTEESKLEYRKKKQKRIAEYEKLGLRSFGVQPSLLLDEPMGNCSGFLGLNSAWTSLTANQTYALSLSDVEVPWFLPSYPSRDSFSLQISTKLLVLTLSSHESIAVSSEYDKVTSSMPTAGQNYNSSGFPSVEVYGSSSTPDTPPTVAVLLLDATTLQIRTLPEAYLSSASNSSTVASFQSSQESSSKMSKSYGISYSNISMREGSSVSIVSVCLFCVQPILSQDTKMFDPSWNTMSSGHCDDCSFLLPDLGFDFFIGNMNVRNTIWVSSNSYITFQSMATMYWNLGLNNPPQLTLHIGSHDDASLFIGWQSVTEEGEVGVKVRVEGSRYYWLTGYDLAYEVTFFASNVIRVEMIKSPWDRTNFFLVNGTTSYKIVDYYASMAKFNRAILKLSRTAGAFLTPSCSWCGRVMQGDQVEGGAWIDELCNLRCPTYRDEVKLSANSTICVCKENMFETPNYMAASVNFTCVPCPLGSFSPRGSRQIADCKCHPGAYLSSGNASQLNASQLSSLTCQECPVVLPTGASFVDQCEWACSEGFSPMSVGGKEVCVPSRLASTWYSSADLQDCVPPSSWDALLLTRAYNYTTGGLGLLGDLGRYEVWVCVYGDACSQDPKDAVCYVYDEIQRAFYPW